LNPPDSGIESHSGTEKSESDDWLSQSKASVLRRAVYETPGAIGAIDPPECIHAEISPFSQNLIFDI
jgi:hypothetical protein